MMKLRLLSILLIGSLLAPLALAGHVRVDVNPCEGVGAAGLPIVGCRDGEPIPDCWRRDGREGWPIYDPLLCPGSQGDASCIALGLHVEAPLGLLSTQTSRSDASASWGAEGGSSAAQQRADTLVASEGTLVTDCRADLAKDCGSVANARAAGVSLLGGLIEADALDAHVRVGCDGVWTQETHFTHLVINGVDQGPIVHPSRIVIPGVAIVTLGATDTFPTVNGGWGMSATALRVDLLDGNGNPTGLVLVSHAAAALR